MSGDFDRMFLTDTEKNQIITNYTRFLELLKPDELVPLLVQNNHMTPYEKSEFQSKTSNQKSEYIIDNVFLKATYEQILDIRKLLLRKNRPGLALLAKLLPSRGETIEVEIQPSQPEPKEPSRWVSPTSDDGVEVMKSSGPIAEPVSQNRDELSLENAGKSIPPADLTVSQVSGMQSMTYESQPDITSLSLNAVPTQPQSVMKPTPQFFSKLGYYPVKKGNPEGIGEALVVVIANFTDDLYGYHKDTDDIVAFFQEEMKYKYVYSGKMGHTSLTNLSRREMMNVLKHIQDFLCNPLSGHNVDRFYLFLLSHGNEDGIMTCKEGSSYEVEYDKLDNPVVVTMKEIMDMFTHDQVETLRGYPKVIFQQACQGKEAMKFATIPQAPANPSVNPVKRPSKDRPLAIGADILICEATLFSFMALVSDNQGSLFIQTVLYCMREHGAIDHLSDILVEVNRLIAHTQKLGKDPKTHQNVTTTQMPGVINRLTAKLFLKGPPGLITTK